MATARDGAGDRLMLGIAVLLVPLVVATSHRLFNDGDVYWHVATGRWILEHGRIPHADPFSATFAGRPWVAFEYGSQLAMALAERVAGLSGLALLGAGLFAALNVVVVLWARRFVGPLRQFLLLAALDGVLVTFVAMRPHLFGWLLLALWTILLLRAREAKRAPSPWAALLIVLWANLHASWVIGILVAAVLGLEAMIECGWKRPAFLGWLGFGLLSLAAALLTANGVAGFLHPFNVSQLRHLGMIEEWKPSRLDWTPTFFIAAFGLAWALAARWRSVPPVRAALIAGLGALALWQVRHQAPAVIVGTLLAAPMVANRRQPPPLFQTRAEKRWVLGAAALLLALGSAARLAVPLDPGNRWPYPKEALAAVPPDLRRAPLFNTWSYGGPLIYRGFRPYIDGRSDMYGDAFVMRFAAIKNGNARLLEEDVERYGLRWAMLKPDEPIARALSRDPRWQAIHADRVAIVFRRVTR